MEINDIIKKDSDRLFQTDYECYLIFTGYSTEDEHPFIRIGNWKEMPDELIPLIKNIVVTDSLTGNPCLEKFNIKQTEVKNCCYIGSEEVLEAYINFQKLFGLDLSSAETVDIKKDIPEISKEKNLSDDDQFFGVFYKDGSFKTLHKGSTILELKNTQKQTALIKPDADGIFYGAGLFIKDGLPVFFHKGNLLSFMISSVLKYRVKGIIYPSKDYGPLSSYLKNFPSGESITVFSDYSSAVSLLQKLFRKINIIKESLSGMKWFFPSGALAEIYHGTSNFRLTYPDGFRCAFIYSAEGIKVCLKDKLDAVFINYSAYRNSVLFFKGSTVPVALINDTDDRISARLPRNTVLLKESSVYHFIKQNDTEKRIKKADVYGILKCPEEKIREIILSVENDKERYNALTLLRMRINSAAERDEFHILEKIYTDVSAEIPDHGSEADIIFLEGNIYLFSLENPAPFPETDNNPDIYIEEDRRRLNRLLDLYREKGFPVSGISGERHRQSSLEASLSSVEKKSSSDMESVKTVYGNRHQGYSAGTDSENKSLPMAVADALKNMDRKKAAACAGAVILAVLFLLLFTGRGCGSDQKTVPANTQEISAPEKIYGTEVQSDTPVPSSTVPGPEKMNAYENIPDSFKSGISDTDIYRYVNKIAVKNGYPELSAEEIKNKNPNRIFPEDTFIMPDGQTVTVVSGDSLWKLAGRKLIELDIKFYETIKQAEKASGNTRTELIREAEEYSFSAKHREILSGL